MWRSVIRPMLGAYTAPRFVVIQDMRVGIPHKVLICVIIAYVLFNIISNQSYLYTETPQASRDPRKEKSARILKTLDWTTTTTFAMPT
eukprot:jgi/Pico_ML_1/53620/g4141.t1